MGAFRMLKPGDQVVVRIGGRDVVCAVLDVRSSAVFEGRDIVDIVVPDGSGVVTSVYSDDSHVRGPTALSLLEEAAEGDQYEELL